METWKPVLGFEALYEVSDLGNVRRVARSKIVDAAKMPQAKEMFAAGATLKEVAAFLGVSIPTAHSIKQGKTWVGNAAHRLCKTTLLNGYLQASLCKNAKYTRRAVHRLMWEAFNGAIPGRLEINHKNLDRADNRLDNLELVTHQQNIQHAIDAYKNQGLLRAIKGVKGFVAGRHSKYDNS
ncbi:HNH nuclease [uncultured Caudovirales phage]|jgi:hypothetical protein|uniref:HNH nuclease n=1 Tax=uncultured Caudovirales phage TaxID=2100421 RepID=A0A6J5NMN1_9CAUD|nr:HNH nuclease [uncultured Caudovirales phage]